MTEIRVIAHRGNIDGPSPHENDPRHVSEALEAGFDVEIDVWYVDDYIWYGHDYPKYRADQEEFNKIIPYAWLHCKNIEAAAFLANHFMTPNFFWHEDDTITLTSHNYLWTYPGASLTPFSVAVMPETVHQEFEALPYAICTDYALAYQELLK